MTGPLHDFILEAREHLAAFEQALLTLETEPTSDRRAALVDQALRVIHSLKGDAGFLGLMAIRDLAHAMETLLENSRREVGLPPAVVMETLLAARDQLAHLVEHPHQATPPGWQDLWQRLQPGGATGGEPPAPVPSPLSPPSPPPLPPVASEATGGSARETAPWILEVCVDFTTIPSGAGSPLVSLVQAIASLGTLSTARLETSPGELTQSLVAGPVIWRAWLTTGIAPAEVAGRWPDLWRRGNLRACLPGDLVAIDLRATTREGRDDLCGWLRRLGLAGGLSQPRLDVSETDLRASLPVGPVRLLGERPAGVTRAAWQAALTGLPCEWLAAAVAGGGDSSAPERPTQTPTGPGVGSVPAQQMSEPKEIAAISTGRVEALPSAGLPVGDQSEGHEGPALAGGEAVRTEALRVRVDLLDRLVDLVGELTLVRNQSLQVFSEATPAIRSLVQRLGGVTSQLQEAVLKTRLQPVSSLFGRFPRLVRDLSRQLGKQVELVTEGTAVELDKTVLELLSDPLNHLVRNSLDHGIETPEERLTRGKPAVGRLTLSATPADGQVVLEIRDDGRGIDPGRVRAKALSLGWKTEAELDRLTPRELLALVLEPGFSTARQVTEISGRGVGMDVVRTNVEQLDGSLTMDSVPGQGTAIRLRVPLSMAILPCLLVRVGTERFLIPQRDLEEIVCLRPGGSQRVESAHRSEFYRLRGRLLPVVRLGALLGLGGSRRPAGAAAGEQPGTEPPGELRSGLATGETNDPDQPTGAVGTPGCHRDESEVAGRSPPGATLVAGARWEEQGLRLSSSLQHLLVVRARGQQFAVVVDQVLGTQEVVVKPLHPALRRLGVYGGAALMGDGRVALIASLEGIARQAGVFDAPPDAGGAGESETGGDRDPREVHRVLLFESGPDEQFALPLVQIRRLVMVDPTRIERIQGAEYLTVDGVSTRVITLDAALGVSPARREGQMFLLLPKFVPEAMGILISRILDTDTLAVDLQPPPPGEPGVLGTALIRDRLTLFVHLQHVRERVYGTGRRTGDVGRGRVGEPGEPGDTEGRSRAEAMSVTGGPGMGGVSPAGEGRVLLIDDTAFFREVVRRYLEAEGWQVDTAADGDEGLERLLQGCHDLVICDIEMPGRNGWEVARQARERGCGAPLLALTSLSRAEHEARARECGFDEFEEKLDHDRLIATVRRMLANRRQGSRSGSSPPPRVTPRGGA